MRLHSAPTLSFTVRISYLEVYNEQMIDLLAPTTGVSISDNPTVVEEKNGSTHVKGLKIENANNEAEEALNLLLKGETNRSILSTNLIKDQQDHIVSFYSVHRVKIKNESSEKTSHQNLIWLTWQALERLSKTETKGSLTYLEQVIIALSDKKRDHIPFRQSKMTHVLRDSLGGNCNTLMIANIWGEQEHIEETISTLRFATRMILEGELEGVQQRALKQVSENPTGSKESSFDPHLDPGLSSGGFKAIYNYLTNAIVSYQKNALDREIVELLHEPSLGINVGSIRERKTGATPLSRADEFEAFKCSKGAELNRILAENKLALREKRRVAKELAESVNQITQELNELKGSLDQKTDAHIKNNQSRQKLMSEFEQWYESIYGSQNTDGGGTGVEDVLDIGEKFDILQMERMSKRIQIHCLTTMHARAQAA
ncbi:hypothetical protein BSLG_006580 [Batrachochytrium salamandrivorans]|nr:hypothetical protein BSLG_006580 [Batrachochytrium salamandrivorans]